MDALWNKRKYNLVLQVNYTLKYHYRKNLQRKACRFKTCRLKFGQISSTMWAAIPGQLWGPAATVKFWQATWPWYSDVRLNQIATNDIKMGYLLTGTWPTPENIKQTNFKFTLGRYVTPPLEGLDSSKLKEPFQPVAKNQRLYVGFYCIY